MPRLIFVNLPVSDLARSTAFYQALGAAKDERFCDGATAACLVFSETIHVMLLTHDKFRQFTPKNIANARETSEVLICISADSREAVDAMEAGSWFPLQDVSCFGTQSAIDVTRREGSEQVLAA